MRSRMVSIGPSFLTFALSARATTSSRNCLGYGFGMTSRPSSGTSSHRSTVRESRGSPKRLSTDTAGAATRVKVGPLTNAGHLRTPPAPAPTAYAQGDPINGIDPGGLNFFTSATVGFASSLGGLAIGGALGNAPGAVAGSVAAGCIGGGFQKVFSDGFSADTRTGCLDGAAGSAGAQLAGRAYGAITGN